MGESELSMKLLVDSQSKRVLFAEASKECVDFLFYILTLTVSTLIRLLGKQGMVGSLANLYESIEALNQSYIQPNKTKDTLLKPTTTPLPGYSVPLLSIDGAPTTVKQFYRCCGDCDTLSDDPRTICTECSHLINLKMAYVAPPGTAVQQETGGGEGGFVKGVVTYMVMDDLIVKPMSTISSITLLNQFNIKDVLALEEKVVTLGMDQAVKLLKASLETDKVLTKVFFNVSN